MSLPGPTPEILAKMEELVCDTTLPYSRIAKLCGVGTGTVYRRAKDFGWTRPAGVRRARRAPVTSVAAVTPVARAESTPSTTPMLPALDAPEARMARSPAEVRQAAIERLWAVVEQGSIQVQSSLGHFDAAASRNLANLARTADTLARLASTEVPKNERSEGAGVEDEDDDGRSLDELRDEFYAHLVRIRAERGIVEPPAASSDWDALGESGDPGQAVDAGPGDAQPKPESSSAVVPQDRHGIIDELWKVVQGYTRRMNAAMAKGSDAALSRDLASLVTTTETLAKVLQNWPAEPMPEERMREEVRQESAPRLQQIDGTPERPRWPAETKQEIAGAERAAGEEANEAHSE